MLDSRSPESPNTGVLAVGPLPPPATGMTLVTEKIIERMQESGPVTVLNISPGPITTWPVFRAKRFLRTLACLGRLILLGPVGDARFYVVANSKGGLLTTLALVNVGRLLGYQIYLHHHTYFYIDRYDWRMAWIDRCLGKRGVHVVHCPQMARDYCVQYATRHPFQFVLPSVFSLPVAAPRQASALPMRLGHMGNLSIQKGLVQVLETFRQLTTTGRELRLHMAGTIYTAAAERLVKAAMREFPRHIDFIGPVHGQAKTDYFQTIDCFLFPSSSESWGIVLNEAMSAGVPVIANRRGCISTQVGDRAGLIIGDASQFVPLATRQITAWMDSPELYGAASLAAIERASELQREGSLTLSRFVEHIMSATLAHS